MHSTTCPARTGPAAIDTAPGPPVYRIDLPAGAPAAMQARRHVWAIIHTWDVPIDAYAAALLTSDLVTEIHSRDERAAVHLMISWLNSEFRVDVRGLARGGRGPGEEGGPGLALAIRARRSLHSPPWRGLGGPGQCGPGQCGPGQCGPGQCGPEQ